MKRKYLYLGLLGVAIALLGIFIVGIRRQPIKYAISPYQDTALPFVAERNGWYSENGLNVDLKLLDWGNVMDAVAGGAVDVAIQNFNSFQATYHNINDRGGDVVFYYPLYIFRGAAIMSRPESGMKSVNELIKQTNGNRDEAIRMAAMQLKGKRVITTKGTEMEQVVLAAIAKAGLDPETDVKIVNAQPADGLRAFIAGEADAFSGGLTERTEARRQGAIELLSSADVTAPVIDGLVTTRSFAAKHSKELDQLVEIWFRTIRWMDENLENRSKIVIDYLSSKGSTKYSVDEYKYAWYDAEVFPRDVDAIKKAVFDENAPYFWKKSWDANNKFLMAEKKISRPVPYDAFLPQGSLAKPGSR
jgi:ABC-type nitrate/sulfonate/bicarbonate transport system substrate-binding protein